MSRVTIHWGAAGYTVTCSKLAVVANAMKTIASDASMPSGPLPMRHGLAIELLTIELRAAGHTVTVHVRPGHGLRHACGHIYSTEAWQALPFIEQVIPSITGPDVALCMRRCVCGSHITYASLAVVAPAGTNAPGGAA